MTKRLLVWLIGAILLSACSRSVVSSSKEEYSESKKEQLSSVKELNKKISETITEKNTVTGDTLIGEIVFSDSDAQAGKEKTLESSGTKITASLEKTDAGYQVNIKNVVKPKVGTERTVKREVTTSDSSALVKTSSDTTHKAHDTDKKKQYSLLVIYATSGGLSSCWLLPECGSGGSISAS